MKTYTLEEVLPLIRAGREFNFFVNSKKSVLSQKHVYHRFSELVNAKFTAVRIPLKNFKELEELLEVEFDGIRVTRDSFGDWVFPDGKPIRLTKRTLDITQWSKA